MTRTEIGILLKSAKPHRFGLLLTPLMALTLSLGVRASAGQRSIVSLKDFSMTEVKSGGFRLLTDTDVHIHARGGGGERRYSSSRVNMYAYGWIIDASTREVVWLMDRNNTKKDQDDRTFDGDITLPRGSYEVYYSAYGYYSETSFSTFDINVDRRKGSYGSQGSDHRGFFDWFGELFGGDRNGDVDWQRRSKEWGIEVSVDASARNVETFSPPQEFSNILFKATRLGENEHVRQEFTLSAPMSMRVYALGEKDASDRLADYGWILNVKTRNREWQMQRGDLMPAGGADKNVKVDQTISLPAGQYLLYYITDDSHSYVDWNAPPPSDPLNYGITLMAVNGRDKENFKLVTTSEEDKNIVVQLVRLGNNATKSATFELKREESLHIYALGEARLARRQMADYGWIIDDRTRQRVWNMDYDRTENAGGAEKNRMIDEVITLPKGDYTVVYQTDDSHAYNEWNDSPPFDPDHWGITVSGEGDNFSMSDVEKNPTVQAGIIAQIVRVGNNANRTVTFRVDAPTRVRVYALGEGQNREMYDYGWIENSRTGTVVWEMTYSMTFHAGGGRKNRMVNTTILLDKGDYTLHYTSDDSHSYNDWNTDPPDDPTMWGITLYAERP